MDWRTFVYARLLAEAGVTDLVPAARIYGAGAMTGHPGAVPFLVLRFGPDESRAGRAAREGECAVWAHDDPGSYLRIDEVLAAVRVALDAPVSEAGAVAVEWQGMSGDLSDDQLDTITRNASYRLTERSYA